MLEEMMEMMEMGVLAVYPLEAFLVAVQCLEFLAGHRRY